MNRFSATQVSVNDKFDNPYSTVIYDVTKQIGWAECIYSNLTTDQEKQHQRLPKLIELYKQFVIAGELSTHFQHQILSLFKFKESETSCPIIENYYELLFHSLFEALIKTKTSQSSKYAFALLTDLVRLFPYSIEIKKHNRQLYFMNKAIELAEYFATNPARIDANVDDSCLDSFLKFINEYSYTLYKIKMDSSLLRPCLQLIISILKINLLDVTSLMTLFRCDKFFNLSNYSKETALILDGILTLIYKSDTHEVVELDNLIDVFMEKVKVFKKVLDSLQPILFDKVLCAPIEQNIGVLRQPYKKALNTLMHFFSFDSYPKQDSELKRLQQVFQRILTEEIFNSIQPQSCAFYYQPGAFYLDFFKVLTKGLSKRSDIALLLENDILELFNLLIARNEFYNEFYDANNGRLMNYLIFQEFMNNLVLTKKDSQPSLVKKLIEISFLIKDQDLCDETNNTANSYIQSAAFNYKKVLAMFADKVWAYYIEEDSNTFMFPVIQIFKYSVDAFRQNGFDSKYHAKCLRSDAAYFSQNYSVLSLIITFTPEYFMFKEVTTGHLRIYDLINCAFGNKKDAQFALYVLYVLSQLIEVLKTRPELLVADLFHERKLIHQFLYYAKLKTPNDKAAQSTLPAGFNNLLIINNISNFYMMLSMDAHNGVNFKDLIMELIEIAKTVLSQDCIVLLMAIKDICVKRNQLQLLKENKSFFDSLKDDKEVKDLVQSILDIVEGRSLEMIETKLTEKVQDQQVVLNDLNANLANMNVKLDEIDEQVDHINNKTLMNVPEWGLQISEMLHEDWILLAKRLNYSNSDILGWLNQSDPCMCMFQEWFITNKTTDAITGLVKALKSIDKTQCVQVIEARLEQIEAENKLQVEETQLDLDLEMNPPQVFISFEWSSMKEALLLKTYLEKEDFVKIWFDDGKMGGGNIMNKRIDLGIRMCKILICLITQSSSMDRTCLNQVNLAIQLGKPIIPLLLDPHLKWPPVGTLGPILSEYLFVRFYQRPQELTGDERYWPVDKFAELLMQLRSLVPPLVKTELKQIGNPPEVFISYQWDKQKQIIKLFNRFKSIGINCWLDIHEMGGGDSLYDKIDGGVRSCALVISCITSKYSLSANCRKEVALADSVGKPIIPILLVSNRIFIS